METRRKDAVWQVLPRRSDLEVSGPAGLRLPEKNTCNSGFPGRVTRRYGACYLHFTMSLRQCEILIPGSSEQAERPNPLVRTTAVSEGDSCPCL